jgi:hypothetical protein
VLSHWVPTIAGHRVLRAAGVAQFAVALLRTISFPAQIPWGLINFVPAVLLMGVALFQRRPLGDSAWLNVAVLCWLLTQYTALAFGRAVAPVESRYADMFQLGIIINVVAALSLAPRGVAPAAWHRAGLVLLAGWFVFMAASVGITAYRRLPPLLAERQRQEAAQVANIGRYLATGDAAALAGKSPNDIAYPDAQRLRMLLDDPMIRSILPPSLLHDGRAPTLIERLKQVVLAWHFILTAAGVALFLLAAHGSVRRPWAARKNFLDSEGKNSLEMGYRMAGVSIAGSCRGGRA